ncbi:MAG: hypothetical protein HY864_16440 [Chloroflexi bacterium]|nr:hypothetical protein [Chloroflexota bacterium]
MKPHKLVLFVLVALLVIVAAGCAPKESGPAKVELPAGKAFAEGQEIYFVHTEVSDPDIAKLLSDMMTSPVLYVPSLANVPDESLANVYVFENGLTGMGPLGFQADVFDNPPGTDGYSPLRRLNVVKWADPSTAVTFTSVDEIMAAQDAGEVTIAQPGVVVNMPFVVWDGGQR